jgi:hypothetical protein
MFMVLLLGWLLLLLPSSVLIGRMIGRGASVVGDGGD